MAAHNDLGMWDEEPALRYLESRGYGILHSAPRSERMCQN